MANIYTPIKVSEGTNDILKAIKLKLKLKSIDAVIKYLIQNCTSASNIEEKTKSQTLKEVGGAE